VSISHPASRSFLIDTRTVFRHSSVAPTMSSQVGAAQPSGDAILAIMINTSLSMGFPMRAAAI